MGTIRKMTLASVLAAGGTVLGQDQSYTPGEGAAPWHDRLGQWVMVDVPEAIRSLDSIPRQSCGARGLVLPAGTFSAVTIGVSDSDMSRIASSVRERFLDTGLDFAIQSPKGGRKLPYSVLVFRQPPSEIVFDDFGAGIVLLALSDLGGVLSGDDLRPLSAIEAGILTREQEFDAQPWPFQPGPRRVKMHVREPAAGVGPNTGLMLCLHNWGGRYNDSAYLQWCEAFANRYNVVTASVNYLQSGDGEPKVIGEKPYDHGYLQAIDCLRALYHIRRQLREADVPFNPHRCYAMGGSGGGNVSLMVNKLAPHTFACVVDICGMPGLTDGIAYGTGEYGSHLNAGYVTDPQSAAYLSPDMQQIRDPGYPPHLAIQFEANPDNKVIVVHGLDDRSCPVVHKINIFRNMVDAGFHPDGHFLSEWHIDGQAVKTTGHAVGNRQKVVERFADPYLREDGRLALAVPGPDDFERAEPVMYPTAAGRVIVDFSQGPPSVRFEPDP